MIGVRTGSRLHFGLLSLPSAQERVADDEDEEESKRERTFGGIGLMIDQPGIELAVAAAGEWSAEGPLGARALHFAQVYCTHVGVRDSFAIRIASAGREHAGLGTGTQLGLAVARGIAELTRQPARDAVSLARAVGRGQRSAIGIHGFEHGGFLVDGGKRLPWKVAPLVSRLDFPEEWFVLLITPRGLIGTHGPAEANAFRDLANACPDLRATEALCRLALLGILPSLVTRDLAGFADALYEYNRRAGEMYLAIQGGAYAHPRIAEIVEYVRRLGPLAVGQSSWGPTIFVIGRADDMGSRTFIHKRGFPAMLSDCDLAWTRPRNRGAEIVCA